MATIEPPRRISLRLRSRQPSTKTATESKPKSKNVITNDKNSKKINISATDKNLLVSKKNVSVRSNPRSSICLRPRRNRINYCDDSRLLQQYITPHQHKTVIMLQKIDLKSARKVPVYKGIKPERSFEDNNDIYDFKFDTNDTREKIVKKNQRKKGVNRKKGKVDKKTTRNKVTAQPEVIECEVKPSVPDSNHSVEIAQSNSPSKSTKEDVKVTETLEVDANIQIPEQSRNEDIGKETEPARIDTNIQTVEESIQNTVGIVETSEADTDVQVAKKTAPLHETSAKQVERNVPSKPRVMSIEDANNIVVTNSPPNTTEDSRPFRPKNIFDNKTLLNEQNSTLIFSPLMKTLSPIPKTGNTLNIGSPWRSSTLIFSQTKHFIQSTPYKPFETHNEKREIKKKNMETNKDEMNMDKENVDKENVGVNKKIKGRKDKERKKRKNSLREKQVTQITLPISENQTPEKVLAVAPARISLGEIKNFLQKPNVKEDNKQATDQIRDEAGQSSVKQKELVEFLNFSDTFDVLSETEKLSNIGNDAPLFMDLEPSHFSLPPQYSYRRKRAAGFDISDNSSEEKENFTETKLHRKKKKITKSEKEYQKRINEWVQTVNTTFQEVDDHVLVIE